MNSTARSNPAWEGGIRQHLGTVATRSSTVVISVVNASFENSSCFDPLDKKLIDKEDQHGVEFHAPLQPPSRICCLRAGWQLRFVAKVFLPQLQLVPCILANSNGEGRSMAHQKPEE